MNSIKPKKFNLSPERKRLRETEKQQYENDGY